MIQALEMRGWDNSPGYLHDRTCVGNFSILFSAIPANAIGPPLEAGTGPNRGLGSSAGGTASLARGRMMMFDCLFP